METSRLGAGNLMGGEKGYLAFSVDGTLSVCGRGKGAVPYLGGGYGRDLQR